ncbi:CFEM domain-containing protein [Colletotrichum cereale]|nr:CFEM domain-containing protein [Colletotrichum cereale]
MAVRFFALLACVFMLGSVVSALDSTSSQSLPPCGLKCVLQEIRHSDCSIADQTCMCNDEVFTGYVQSCVMANCTIKEMLVAKNRTSTLCGVPVAQHDNLIPWIQLVLFVLPTLFVITRIVHKCMKISPWGWDDTTIMVAYVAFTIFTPAGFLSAKTGAGRDVWYLTPEQITRGLKTFFALTFLYMLGLAFVKASILFLYLRVFPDQRFRRVVWYTQAFNLVLYIAFLSASLASCRPLHHVWDGWTGETEGKCFNVNASGLAHAALNLALDVWMLLLPASQIYKLNVPLKQKTGVVLMFSVGIFLTAVSGYRIKVLRPSGTSLGSTAASFQTSIWSAVELAAGIFVACLPSTREVWAVLLPRLLRVTHASPRSGASEASSTSDLAGGALDKAESSQTDASAVEAAPGEGVKATIGGPRWAARGAAGSGVQGPN